MYNLLKKYRRPLIYIGSLITIVILILSLALRHTVSRYGKYHDKYSVALYIYEFKNIKELPRNYVTYEEAVNDYGDVYEAIRDKRSIGGDKLTDIEIASTSIRNYTNTETLYRCDIYKLSNEDTAKARDRGPCYLVYSFENREIYYTDDNGLTFVKMNKWNINTVSNVLLIIFGVIFSLELAATIYVFTRVDNEKFMYIKDLRDALVLYAEIVFSILILPIYLIYKLVDTIIMEINLHKNNNIK